MTTLPHPPEKISRRRPARAGDIIDPRDPLAVAKRFVDECYQHRDGRTIHHSADVLYTWNDIAYAPMEPTGLRAQLWLWLADQRCIVQRGDDEIELPIKPTKTMVDGVIDALRAVAYIARQSPCWLSDAAGLPDPAKCIVGPSGIYDLAGDKMLPLTPTLFTTTAIDFHIGKPGAEPWEWLEFLNTLWPDGTDLIATLQEWFGLCLTAETQYQKILLLVGPKRSGKGTIARVLTRLIGMANVCAPTLAGLAMDFGAASLIHARLAIIGDARLSGRTDLAIVAERLLSISGEDGITIPRKYCTDWTGRLATRLMLLTNELPRFADASGALASRFIPLILRESFFGREDIGLEARLLTELPLIFWWAVAGYRRLTARRQFIGTIAGQDAIDQLTDLASPVGAFVRDWCNVASGQQTPRGELYDAWRAWCASEGRQHVGDAATFGRDLKAAVPGIADSRPKMEGERIRAYEGIGLTISAQQEAETWRAKGGAK